MQQNDILTWNKNTYLNKVNHLNKTMHFTIMLITVKHLSHEDVKEEEDERMCDHILYVLVVLSSMLYLIIFVLTII